MPINHQENILISIMELGSTHSIYSFDSKKDYENIVKKMENLECITNSIMFNMKKGIKNKVTLPKIIAIKVVKTISIFQKKKSYKNTNIKIN